MNKNDDDLHTPSRSEESRLKRTEAVSFVENSAALEGYSPLTKDDGLAFSLRERWVNGEIGEEERISKLLDEAAEGE